MKLGYNKKIAIEHEKIKNAYKYGYERGLHDKDRATNDDAVVRCLGLPARPYNCVVLHAASPNNIFGRVYSQGQDIPLSEFVGVSESDLRRIRNMTVKTCSQVIVALSEHGIVLKDGVFCREQ